MAGRSKILVGNLSTDATEERILELFAETTGAVLSVSIPLDPKTGKNRGYAFVEMDEADAEKAIGDLNGRFLAGRAIAISVVEKLQKKFKWYKLGLS